MRHHEAGSFCKAGAVGAGEFEDLVGLLDRQFEVTVSKGGTTLEHVIGRDPDEGELPEKVGQDNGVAVYSPGKWGLVHDYRSCVTHQFHSTDRLRGEFPGMVEMCHQVDLLLRSAVFPDHGGKRGIVRDPEGIERGDLAPDADYLHVIDLPDPGDDRLEPGGRKNERVTPGEQDVGDLGMLSDIGHALRKVAGDLVFMPHKKSFPEAVAAYPSTHVRGEDQCGLGGTYAGHPGQRCRSFRWRHRGPPSPQVPEDRG